MLLYDITVVVYKARFIPGSVQQIIRYFSSSLYNGNLIIWTSIGSSTHKFKPLTFCKIWGFHGAKFLRTVGSYKSHRRNIPEDAILLTFSLSGLYFHNFEWFVLDIS
jgi:hypothetical protein